MRTYDASPAALRPLFDAFWSPQGWRDPPVLPSGAQFESAVSAGVMFVEDRFLEHDAWVEAARAAARSISAAEVEEAFIASLASRRLGLRSALGSYAVARHLPAHAFQRGTTSGCALCGLQEASGENLNVLNFERSSGAGCAVMACAT